MHTRRRGFTGANQLPFRINASVIFVAVIADIALLGKRSVIVNLPRLSRSYSVS
jgi:hypothetical protein